MGTKVKTHEQNLEKLNKKIKWSKQQINQITQSQNTEIEVDDPKNKMKKKNEVQCLNEEELINDLRKELSKDIPNLDSEFSFGSNREKDNYELLKDYEIIVDTLVQKMKIIQQKDSAKTKAIEKEKKKNARTKKQEEDAKKLEDES